MSKLLIDGSNVCGWDQASRKDPLNLLPLITLVSELRRGRGDKFLCLFDARTRYKLMPGQDKFLDELLKFRDYFGEVTGGMRADDVILQEANESGASVITNDRYRDPEYQTKYPWVADGKRLIKGGVFAGRLSIPGLDLSRCVFADSDVKLTNLRECFAPEFDSAVVRVERIWFDHNCRKGDEWGMQMHAALVIRGHRGERFSLAFFFYFPNGKLITLTNDAPLLRYVELEPPPYYSTVYRDQSLFFSYATFGSWTSSQLILISACIHDDTKRKYVFASEKQEILFTPSSEESKTS